MLIMTLFNLSFMNLVLYILISQSLLMVLYHQLPLYQTTYKLLIQLYDIVKQFPKEHKYTLGEKIKTTALELLIGMYQANIVQDSERYEKISVLREWYEMLKIMIRISRDIRIVSLTQYADLSLLLDSVGKQLIGWQKSLYA